ncbi:hypothetical protein KEG57_53295 [Polyangium jinanense]|uniref:Uncharacterized protein n=1 Tax=Polyangium jinanense TaxID=2829994 RepID=A0A9X3XHB1_9BACT|nr:hypothetical protein [Polyangium jinanense]
MLQRAHQFPRFASEEEANQAEKYYGLGSHLESDYKPCWMCKGKLQHIGIPESAKGSEYLNYVYHVMRDNDRVLDPSAQNSVLLTMVGIMETDKGWFAANSGKSNATVADFVCSSSSFYLPSRVQWIDSSTMNARSAYTAGGAKIPSEYIKDCQYQNLPFACAAPKLISYALTNGLQIRAMSEVWFGGTASGGQVIWSCKTCQPLLLMLLCPAKH